MDVLFVNNREVWVTRDECPEDEEFEQPYTGPWPVRAWFTSQDCGDGHGWRRRDFEERGKVLEHYLHDVGAGDQTEAVLVEVATPENFVTLCELFNLEDERPEPLYGG